MYSFKFNEAKTFLGKVVLEKKIIRKTRADTRLLQLRAGGQGPRLRSPEHLGRSVRPKIAKPKKVKCDGPTDGRFDGWTDKAGCRVA